MSIIRNPPNPILIIKGPSLGTIMGSDPFGYSLEAHWHGNCSRAPRCQGMEHQLLQALFFFFCFYWPFFSLPAGRYEMKAGLNPWPGMQLKGGGILILLMDQTTPLHVRTNRQVHPNRSKNQNRPHRKQQPEKISKGKVHVRYLRYIASDKSCPATRFLSTHQI